MDRRGFLRLVGLGGIGSLAGCGTSSVGSLYVRVVPSGDAMTDFSRLALSVARIRLDRTAGEPVFIDSEDETVDLAAVTGPTRVDSTGDTPSSYTGLAFELSGVEARTTDGDEPTVTFPGDGTRDAVGILPYETAFETRSGQVTLLTCPVEPVPSDGGYALRGGPLTVDYRADDPDAPLS